MAMLLFRKDRMLHCCPEKKKESERIILQLYATF